MERTSLITLLYAADYTKWPFLVLEGGYPDAASLEAHFILIPAAQESSEITEALEDTDQGRLVRYTVRTRIFRESTLYDTFRQNHLILYLETLNGERYLLGNGDNPMELVYNRPSGMAISDSNETSLTMTGTFPL